MVSNDSSTLHLLSTLFLSLLHQLHLRLTSIRSWKLGAPGISDLSILFLQLPVTYNYLKIKGFFIVVKKKKAASFKPAFCYDW